jgi:hypothetical protein
MKNELITLKKWVSKLRTRTNLGGGSRHCHAPLQLGFGNLASIGTDRGGRQISSGGKNGTPGFRNQLHVGSQRGLGSRVVHAAFTRPEPEIGTPQPTHTLAPCSPAWLRPSDSHRDDRWAAGEAKAIGAVWFSFWAASGRQKQKLQPNAEIFASLLGAALQLEADRPQSAGSGPQFASVRSPRPLR